ncbi:MAG: hypothetical protein GH151_08650 [Bacteroidetes bacterium]|nr:hypothetical protein [Bacteroidota bacterium]
MLLKSVIKHLGTTLTLWGQLGLWGRQGIHNISACTNIGEIKLSGEKAIYAFEKTVAIPENYTLTYNCKCPKCSEDLQSFLLREYMSKNVI